MNPEIINRKINITDISNKVKYFPQYRFNNGGKLFDLHTVKDTMGDSQVGTLLVHDFQTYRNWQIKLLKEEDKLSDTTNPEWVFGDPDFKPDTFLINRGLGSGEEIEEENTVSRG